MCKMLLFAGTTEGREIAEYIKDTKVSLTVSVATEYGETLIDKSSNINVSANRLSEEEMTKLLSKEKFDLVIDATHPYAVEVTKNIKESCISTNTKYLRVIRGSEGRKNDNGAVYVNNIDEAIDYLENTTGNILVTTGSKEIDKFTNLKNYKERVFARVLSTDEVVQRCNDLGFKGRNLIAMQGPFTKEFNTALLRQIDADYLVTKESGKAGGYEEKIVSAKEAGATAIVIGRPKEEKGYSFEETIKYINNNFEIKPKRRVSLVSIGLGDVKTMTLEAKETFENSDVIIGAGRMLETLKTFGKPSFKSYKAVDILRFIEENSEYKNIAIAYSGDVGFYSGAKRMLEKLQNYEVNVIPGVSSVVYFASKIKMAWEDIKLISMHGKDANIVGEVQNNKRVFTLLGGEKCDISSVCMKLCEYGLGDIKAAVGCNLSYPDEKIQTGRVKDFVNCTYKGLCVAAFFNDNCNSSVYKKISDNDFIRDKVPMSKEEVRSLSIIKLGLEKDSILYDIGAGTGSISIEAALNVPEGRVFAIEKKGDAVNLINKNKEKFKVDNLEVVHGKAPDALMNLDIPTHAFIGGSSGNLKDIIEVLIYKNPSIKIVINAITLETLSETLECIKKFSLLKLDLIQLQVAKSRQIAGFNMMTGQNPIYIITLKGDGEKCHIQE